MKRPVEPGEFDQTPEEAQGSPPKPFDMFAGLVQEPLPPVQGELSSVKPMGALVQREAGLPGEETSREDSTMKGDVVVDERGRGWSVYVLIAVVALVVGVVVGFVLK